MQNSLWLLGSYKRLACQADAVHTDVANLDGHTSVKDDPDIAPSRDSGGCRVNREEDRLGSTLQSRDL